MPNRGLNGVDDDDTYQSFPCIACTRVHLVNLKIGKVLGEDTD